MTLESFFTIGPGVIAGGLVIAAGVIVIDKLDKLLDRLWPEPPAKAPPATHTIQICDEDGWPLRTYRLTAKELGRLVGDLDRVHPR
jgi:hypothetical protein